MRQIAAVNMKGGVGKTTTAIHLAAGLAAHGSRVLAGDGHVAHRGALMLAPVSWMLGARSKR